MPSPVIIPHKPFIDQDIPSSMPIVPDDLANLVGLGGNVLRYQVPGEDYGHIFHDPVDWHTIRCVWTLDALDLPGGFDREKVIRMLWIHDLPEVITCQDVGHDVTMVEKFLNPDLARQIAKGEDDAAKELFGENDYLLYEDFERAGGLLKTGEDTDGTDPTLEALIAKFIDSWLDGILSFHFFVTEWIQSECFDPSSSWPREDMFRYGVEKGFETWDIIREHAPEYEGLFHYLIENLHHRYIVGAWSQVSIGRAPSYVSRSIEGFLENPQLSCK